MVFFGARVPRDTYNRRRFRKMGRLKYQVRIVVWSLLIAAVLPADAAKRMLILDFRNLDDDPAFAYLEVSLTDTVRKNLNQQYEILEPDPADVRRRIEDGYFLFKGDIHNRNVALHLGLSTGQDVVLSGGFRQINRGAGTTMLLVDVILLDVEHKRQVKRFTGTILVDANLFNSIERLSQRIVAEAKGILPNKGAFDFDIYAPVTQHQLGLLAGYNLNGVLPALRNSQPLTAGSPVKPGDMGGWSAALEYRKDRFMRVNRLIGFAAGNFTLLSSTLPISASDKQAMLGGFFSAIEAGIGYQLFRRKKFFLHILAGGGFFYTRFRLDFAALPSGVYNPATAELRNDFAGTEFGPYATAGLRTGLQLTPTVSWEIGVAYREYFLRGSASGSLSTITGIGFRI